jgi:hypothetical protein
MLSAGDARLEPRKSSCEGARPRRRTHGALRYSSDAWRHFAVFFAPFMRALRRGMNARSVTSRMTFQIRSRALNHARSVQLARAMTMMCSAHIASSTHEDITV